MTTATHDLSQAAAEIAAVRFHLRGFLITAALLLSWVAFLVAVLSILE